MNGFLVIGRTLMDDIPIRMFETGEEALEFTRSMDGCLTEFNREQMHSDSEFFECAGIMPFVNGVPGKIEIVKDWD